MQQHGNDGEREAGVAVPSLFSVFSWEGRHAKDVSGIAWFFFLFLALGMAFLEKRRHEGKKEMDGGHCGEVPLASQDFVGLVFAWFVFFCCCSPALSLYLSLEWVWWVFFSRPHLLSVFVAETDKGLGVLY